MNHGAHVTVKILQLDPVSSASTLRKRTKISTMLAPVHRWLFCVLVTTIMGVGLASTPHIVFVLGDDVGNNDVGYHNPQVQTPAIDRLSAEGVRLAAHYSFNWCAPSRAMLMTGRYVTLHIGTSGGGGTASTEAVASSLPFFPEPLSQQGRYVTHMLGKWHLGHANESRLPVSRGFNSSLGYLTGQEDYYCRTVGANCANSSTLIVNNMYGTTPPSRCPQPVYSKDSILYDWWQDHQPGNFSIESPQHSVFDYTAAAQDIIKQHSIGEDSSKALFLYYASQLVHAPLQVDDRFLNLYSGGVWANCTNIASRKTFEAMTDGGIGNICGRRTHNAMMSALDESIANITQTLRTTGLWANTILIFVSDNGGQVGDQGNNLPYRGAKFDSWEGGVRSAAFVAGPLVPPNSQGSTFHGIVSMTDWAPTIVTLAGLNVSLLARRPGYPSVPAVDGIDLWPALLDPNGSTGLRRNEVYITGGIMRVNRYKLHTQNAGNREVLGCGGGWIPLPTNTSAEQCIDGTSCAPGKMDPRDVLLCGGCNRSSPCLFDVGIEDPGERYNIAAQNQDIVESILARIDALEATTWTPPPTLPNDGKFCAAYRRYGGFNGPWQPL